MSKKIITKLLNYANQSGASDLIIVSQPQHISLDCYLPGGDKHSLLLPKKLETEFFASLRKILAFAPGEILTRGYRKITTKAGEINLYLTVLPGDRQEKIILNLVNRPAALWRLNQLGLTPADRRAVKEISRWRSGLVIITAPTGEGKSATLYSLLIDRDNSERSVYLLTQHPPYTVPGVNLLNPTPANWEAIMQHDSEVIFADSLDEDWALLQAFRAATTGRLVIGTLSAPDKTAARQRLNDLKLSEKIKSAGLKMIISQRLVKLKRPPNRQRASDRQLIGTFEIIKFSR